MPSKSTIAETAGTAPPDRESALRRRVISAAILGPAALIVLYLGPPFWELLVGVIGVLGGWEWSRLCSQGRLTRAGQLGIGAIFATVGVAAIWGASWAIACLAAGTGATMVLAVSTGERAAWHGVGVVYLGLPCISLIWLRNLPETGIATVVWLLAIVWATDIGAYAAGRVIGGPKLAPTISPNKTWAGLAGGTLAAAAAGLTVGLAFAPTPVWILLSVIVGLTFVEQAGDLFESAIKRRFGAKDSSQIIPGHGGVLDRVEGLLAVSVVTAGLTLAHGGSILTWR